MPDYPVFKQTAGYNRNDTAPIQADSDMVAKTAFPEYIFP
jgi:hypothetical protein